MEQTRRCTICLRYKNLSEFYVCDRATGALRGQCKPCYRETKRRYYESVPEDEMKERRRRYYLRNRAQILGASLARRKRARPPEFLDFRLRPTD